MGRGELPPRQRRQSQPGQPGSPGPRAQQARRGRQRERRPRERRRERQGQHHRGAGQPDAQGDAAERRRHTRRPLAATEPVHAEPRQDRLQHDERVQRGAARQHGVEQHRREVHPSGLRVRGERHAAHRVRIPRRDVAGAERRPQEAVRRQPQRQQVGVDTRPENATAWSTISTDPAMTAGPATARAHGGTRTELSPRGVASSRSAPGSRCAAAAGRAVAATARSRTPRPGRPRRGPGT